MKTCVFVPPLVLLGCGFLSSPLDHDHQGPLEADDIARLGPRDGAATADSGVEIDSGTHETGEAGGGFSSDGHIGADEDIESDAAVPGVDADVELDASEPPLDAGDAAVPPDAAEPPDATPDAASDATVDAGHVDPRVCQPCTTNVDCGDYSLCYAAVHTCLPRHPAGGLCKDVCSGLFPTKLTLGTNEEVCGDTNDLAASCRTAVESSTCRN